MPYIQETAICGDVIEVRKINAAIIWRKGKGRSQKKAKTSAAKKKINEKNAERTLRQLINTNFHPGDLFVTLTYKGEAPKPEEAEKELNNFLRRMAREYKKAGTELKYVAVTEYKAKRIHHHLIMNKIDVGRISDQWKRGRPDFKVLDSSGDYAQLASYLIKETARTFKDPGAQGKRWKRSKNLEKPKVVRKIISAAGFRKEPRAFKGYLLDKMSVLFNQWAIGQLIYEYQEYRMIRIKEKERKGKKRDG